MRRGSGILTRVALVVVAGGLLVLATALVVVVTVVVDDKEAGLQDEALDAAALRTERLDARIALARTQLAHLAEGLAAGRIEAAVRQATSGLSGAVLATVEGVEMVEASRAGEALAALRGAKDAGAEPLALIGDFVIVSVGAGDVRVMGAVPWAPADLPRGWRVALEERASLPGLMARREGDTAQAVAPVAPGIALRVVAPLGPARAAVRAMAARVVAWSSLALVPLLVLAWVLSRFVTSPIRHLAQTVAGWDDGRPLDPGRLPENEIGELGEAIAGMSARVHADATALRAAARFGREARGDDTPARVLGELQDVLRETLPDWRIARPSERRELAAVTQRVKPELGPGSALFRLTLPGGGEAIAVEDDGRVVGVVENLLPAPEAELRLARLFARTAEARLRIARLGRQSRAQAKLASAGKVAAAVTHEMNTPLAYVQANLQFLHETLGDAHSELVEDSLVGVARLSRILQDLSATTAGGSLGDFVATDLGEIARAMVRVARTRGPAAALEVRADDATPVECDRGRIEQVVLNLVKNALDVVGPEGRVTVCVGAVGERVFVEVEDDGPGIPEDVRDHLFEAFFTTKGDGGTGLGLHLSRSFVEAHGGSLDVARTGPEGTVFRLELPARAAAENRPAPAATVATSLAPTRAAAPAKVLVVDDEPALVRALTRWLKADAAVTGVTSPSEALSLLAHDHFDLVLCDLHMPELPGDALARQVRALPDPPRVVVMTGSPVAAPDDLTYLRKPLNREQLREVLKAS